MQKSLVTIVISMFNVIAILQKGTVNISRKIGQECMYKENAISLETEDPIGLCSLILQELGKI